jgi:hypothetical protein
MPGSTLEERIAGLEGSYQELTKRIDDFRSETHRGFDNLRNEFTGLTGQFNDLRSEMRTNFRWTMSLILINWLSLITGVLLVVTRK